MTTNRLLRVFLCHSSNDKPAVRELYQKLRAEPWIQPWLDEEELFPGMDWNLEIEKAIEATDVILVCLSNSSITKEGYVQKEITKALDFAEYKPEGTLFIIPVRLEECKPPKRLARWQYADYFEGQREQGLQKLLFSLRKRVESLKLQFDKPKLSGDEIIKILEENMDSPPIIVKDNKITLFNGTEFMQVPAGEFIMGSDSGRKVERPQHSVEIPYDYWMARFPVTNEQYNSYCKAKDIEHPVISWERKKEHPVTRITWMDSIAYCQWLNNLIKEKMSNNLILRLPTEAEWEKAARGIDGNEYPWGNVFEENKCNSRDSGNLDTTPVGLYSPQGDSFFGCADMAGNVWEWTHSLNKPYEYKSNDGRENETNMKFIRVLRGGSWFKNCELARSTIRGTFNPSFYFYNDVGFRICLAPTLPQ